jgi:hypothetical protein
MSRLLSVNPWYYWFWGVGNYEQLSFVWRTKIQFLLTLHPTPYPRHPALTIFHLSFVPFSAESLSKFRSKNSGVKE